MRLSIEHLDEGRRPEDGRVDLDSVQTRPQLRPAPSSTPRVTSSVLPHGNFSTISIRPGPSLMTASPISGWWSSTSRGHVGQREQRAVRRSAIGTWPRSAGSPIGGTLWIASRWFGRVDEPAGADDVARRRSCSRPDVERVRGRLHHRVERDAVPRHELLDRPAPGASRSRSPQIATLATPWHAEQPLPDRPVA